MGIDHLIREIEIDLLNGESPIIKKFIDLFDSLDQRLCSTSFVGDYILYTDDDNIVIQLDLYQDDVKIFYNPDYLNYSNEAMKFLFKYIYIDHDLYDDEFEGDYEFMEYQFTYDDYLESIQHEVTY